MPPVVVDDPVLVALLPPKRLLPVDAVLEVDPNSPPAGLPKAALPPDVPKADCVVPNMMLLDNQNNRIDRTNPRSKGGVLLRGGKKTNAIQRFVGGCVFVLKLVKEKRRFKNG